MTLWQDVRFATRVLRHNPGFTAVAVLTLALGIAANTTVFSWIDAILLQPLPGVRDTSQLVALEEIMPDGSFHACPHPDLRDFQRDLHLVSGVTAAHFTPFTIGQDLTARRVFGQVVAANFFDVLGVPAYRGRTFTSQEDVDSPGAVPLAVISYRLWQTQFHADPAILGQPARVNGRQLTIIGVTPPEFHGTLGGVSNDIWVPLSMILDMGGLNTWAAADRNARFLDTIARLKPGVSLSEARMELRSVFARIARAYPKTHTGVTAQLLPLWQSHYGAQSLLREPLRILMGVCFLVLLIACANVANLLLARSVSRQREFGIRIAMGAGPARLVQQLLIEVLIIAAAGAVVGTLLAQWLAQSLYVLLPATDIPLTGALGGSEFFNLRLLGFTTLICVGVAVISVVLPALSFARFPLNETLKEGGRSGTAGARSHRARGLLVSLEVALAAVTLIGAGLFGRSFHNAQSLHPGFDVHNVLIARFYLGAAGYRREQEIQFDRTLAGRLSTAPGIAEAAYADGVPLWFGDPPSEVLRFAGDDPARAAGIVVSRTLVGPGYFSLMRIPLLAGRDFTDADADNAPNVIIVNQAFARRFFGKRDPLGNRVYIRGCDCWSTVIGLAKNTLQSRPAEPPAPYFYASFPQAFGRGHNNFVYLRTAGPADVAQASIRQEVARLDSTAGIFDVMPLTDYTQAALYPQRVAAILLAGLGILALLLAAAGLYSVISYAVSERTHEFGIRMALGAQRHELIAMIVRKALTMTATGLVAGVLAALVLARIVAGSLVNVSTADPVTFVTSIAFLSTVAVIAAWIPARRATKFDPMTALK